MIANAENEVLLMARDITERKQAEAAGRKSQERFRRSGEAIPRSARLCAIVSIWNALRSDRTYRAGWPEEKVLTHIQSLTETHFEPRVVEAFLRLIREDRASA